MGGDNGGGDGVGDGDRGQDGDNYWEAGDDGGEEDDEDDIGVNVAMMDVEGDPMDYTGRTLVQAHAGPSQLKLMEVIRGLQS